MGEDNKRTVLFDWGDFYTLWAMAYETGYREGYFDTKERTDTPLVTTIRQSFLKRCSLTIREIMKT